MKFELTLYVNEMSQKTEKLVVEGTSFSVVDTSTGPLFVVIGAKSAPVYVCDKSRLHSMQLLTTQVPKKRTIHAIAGRNQEKANG
jgi:hypothetical protein